jgi:hypothetical protein
MLHCFKGTTRGGNHPLASSPNNKSITFFVDMVGQGKKGVKLQASE